MRPKVARQISEVQQNLAQEDARRETVIRAPMTGVVTNIAVSTGQSVALDAPFRDHSAGRRKPARKKCWCPARDRLRDQGERN